MVRFSMEDDCQRLSVAHNGGPKQTCHEKNVLMQKRDQLSASEPPLTRGRAAGMVILVLLMAIPSLLSGLRNADVTYHMEVLTVGTGLHTWRAVEEGDARALLVPQWNGHTRIHKPPLTVWSQILLWTGLTPDRTDPNVAAYRARLFGVGLGLLTILATIWAGRTLHNMRTGLIAGLALATMFLFVKQFRMASYDTYLTAFTTVSMAALLAARQGITGIRPGGVRPWLYAVLAGAALGLAILSKGPLAILFVLLPGVLLLGWRRPSRGMCLLALGVTVLTAAAVALPWYAYILEEIGHSGNRLVKEYQATRSDYQTPFYYVALIALVAPWTFWFIDRFGASIRSRSLKADAGWEAMIWFLAIFIVMSIPGAKQQRYIVPILPAAALLIAEALRVMRTDPKARWRPGSIHAWTLMLLSILLPLFVMLQPLMIRWGALEKPEIAGTPLPVSLVAAVILWMVARLVHRSAGAGDGMRTAWLTALWMMILGAYAYHGYARSYHGRYEQRPFTEDVRRLTEGQSVGHIDFPDAGHYKDKPDEKFLLYFRRPVPTVEPEGIEGGNGPMFMVVPDEERYRTVLDAAGYLRVMEGHDGRHRRAVYRKDKAGA